MQRRIRFTLRAAAWAAVLPLLGPLAGCDQLGIASPAASAAKKEAEARAVGAACRHAGRAIEDCYTLNAKTDKAAIYGGWREMDDHMRENKIEAVAPVIPRPAKVARSPTPASAPDDAEAGAGGEGGEGEPVHQAQRQAH